MTRLVLVLLLGLAFALPASAEWRPDQRDNYMNGCLKSCQDNPNVGTFADRCSAYCSCVMFEAEKFMSPADYDALDKEVRGKMAATPLMQRFRSLTPTCQKNTFGG